MHNLAFKTEAPADAPETALTHAGTVELDVERLAAGYGGTPVFSDVSFSIGAGEIVALVGANGAGKSTLLRCCLGLIAPSAGAIRLMGADPSRLDRRALSRLRRDCGLVAQKHNLVARVSVLSNVMHGLLGAHAGPLYWTQVLAPANAREKAMACLERVGLSAFAHRRADQLSGGQSQRVAVARALVSEPRIVFADEPAASLDPAAGEEVMRVLSALAREAGATVVFTSHHLDHALRYGDRVLALKDQRLVLDVAARDLEPQALRRLYA